MQGQNKFIKRNQFFIFSLIFIGATTCFCEQINNAPDSEKRSCIQAVDGFAYLSEDMTLSDSRSAAFANAKRQAVEMSKTYIKAKTKVTNYVIDYDTIWSESEGMITILEQKDFGIENNTRYHVWIKAEVEYSLKPKTPEIKKITKMAPHSPLTVKVWTPKKNYLEGEAIVINVKGNRDFYARIIDITASGDIIQLLPNDYRKINYFKANTLYKIPDTGDLFTLIASPPFGKDQIIVYASEIPLGQIDLESYGNGLNKYNGDRETLGTKSRETMQMPDKKDNFQGAEFYEAIWHLTTEKK